MRKLNKQGFSMIELLVVLLIIGILAAVAAPLFLSNSTKAKISEGVAGAGSIRSAERTYDSQNGAYLPVTAANAASYFGTASGNQSSILGLQIHGNKFFSSDAYVITVGSGLSWGGTITGVTLNTPQDFLITVTGSNSKSLSSNAADGASNNTEVSGYIVQMDNSGQTIYTADGTTWNKF
jgi:MSHA pilin protein MshA